MNRKYEGRQVEVIKEDGNVAVKTLDGVKVQLEAPLAEELELVQLISPEEMTFL